MKKVTKLTLVMAAVIAFGVGCSDDDDDIVLPPIGGYNNSNEVAASSLKATFAFDGSLAEAGGTAPTTMVRNSFVTGIKGQALHLDSGYLVYPTIAALNVTNPGSMSMSAWVKTQNKPGGATTVATLTMSNATDWNVGPLTMMIENGRPQTYNDTLVFKGLFSTYTGVGGSRLGGDNINDYGVRETDFKTVKGANRWVHYVVRYDGTGSFLDLFADGIRVSNNNFRFRDNAGVGIGPIALPAGSTTRMVVGAFPNSTTGFPLSPLQGWQALYTGDIDQLRVYTKALTDDEILALYQLEKVGR
jgi:hypothetical protein